jgi:hypothetical protein
MLHFDSLICVFSVSKSESLTSEFDLSSTVCSARAMFEFVEKQRVPFA